MTADSSPTIPSRAVVATLVATHGSSPRVPGAKMWVDDRGEPHGSVTIGGCVDARVMELTSEVLAEGTPRLVEMSLGDEDAWALGMTCGGTIELLVEPVNSTQGSDPVVDALNQATAAVRAGERAVIVTPLPARQTSERLVVRTNSSSGSLGNAILDAAATDAARGRLADRSTGPGVVTVGDQSHRLYFECHAPPVTLVVFGATHVAQSLVELAHTVGMQTIVVDGREQMATRSRFPSADDLRVGMPSEIAADLSLGADSLVVVLAHDYKYDLPVLKAVLQTPAAYVGLLGSQRRGKAIVEFLEGDGVGPDALARIHVPVGLDIGARSAPEIALSILAEAVAVYRGRSGGAMRSRVRA